MPSHETIVRRLQERAGLEDENRARAVLDATLGALGTCLARAEAQALADQLPAALAGALHNARFAGACDEDELVRRVAQREGEVTGFALEHVQAVCQLLGEHLDAEVRERLERALPAPLADLIAQPAQPTAAAEASPAPGHTLADGRPGSRNPLSEANPRSDHPVSESD